MHVLGGQSRSWGGTGNVSGLGSWKAGSEWAEGERFFDPELLTDLGRESSDAGESYGRGRQAIRGGCAFDVVLIPLFAVASCAIASKFPVTSRECASTMPLCLSRLLRRLLQDSTTSQGSEQR
jgi:hypothetical protein